MVLLTGKRTKVVDDNRVIGRSFSTQSAGASLGSQQSFGLIVAKERCSTHKISRTEACNARLPPKYILPKPLDGYKTHTGSRNKHVPAMAFAAYLHAAVRYSIP